MPLAAELEVDAAVRDSLRGHPRADARVAQQVRDTLLEHARADAMLAVLAAPRFEDDGLDPLQLEQPAECQAGGAGADDPDLRPHSTTSWNTLKALFAADTPQ
jgi:hypothetical protein